MPHHKPVSGEETVKILCNTFGFSVSGHAGSHVRLSKPTADGKVGTVVPLHDELKQGTLRGVLRLARVDIDDFYRHV
ncbi:MULTISPECIES: type II toxin-antitoxin system HicA family toxin [unclassified Methanoregula]|uniref:type II toxin-antitoxin system HicA family toxin n=1 Tax=unclassified Methanoregula TaxID=2649730 RepID=UPI0025E481E7|nr:MULTISPECIES: type II toxin-antitoxin system HicA family toxin [unclassified Methanoregula]